MATTAKTTKTTHILHWPGMPPVYCGSRAQAARLATERLFDSAYGPARRVREFVIETIQPGDATAGRKGG